MSKIQSNFNVYVPDVGLELLLESAEDGGHVVSGGGVLTVEIHDALLQEAVLRLRVVAEVVACMRG